MNASAIGTSNPVERVLALLPDARKNGTGYMARCPAHDDQRASLSIADGEDGKCVLHCFAGCSTETIVTGLGLSVSDLFPPKKNGREVVATYDYKDESGALLYQVVRYFPKDFRQRRPDGKGGWIWSLDGVRRVLFGLPEIVATAPAQLVVVCEGEKDCIAVRKLGFVATTNAAGAGKWRPEYSESLRGRSVAILPDNDAAGAKHALVVAESLSGIAARVCIVELSELKKKGDVFDWIGAGGTRDDLLRLIDQAPQAHSVELQAPPEHAHTDRPLTDTGNAERFADMHSNRFRFIPEWGAWITFDCRRWVRDTAGAVKLAAIETVRRMHGEAEAIQDAVARRAQAQHALRSESSRSILSMLELAKVDKRVVLSADRLDAPPTKYLFNVLNGTLDVRTGALKPHDPADLITKLASVTFEPGASTEPWEVFLERVLPDSERRAFLARFIGSSLTGDTGDQCFILAHGSGANGKSTAIAAVERLLGDYACSADFETFLQATAHTDRRGGARADLMAFRGVRFVGAIETGDGRRLNETLVKSLTGGDTITARAPFDREQTSFVPQLHLMLSANERPEIRGTDHAVWRRVLNVEFAVTIPEDERDATLLDRLTSSEALSGMLNWALIGARDWFDLGVSNRLRPPDAVRAATAEYREGQDILAAFIADRCELDVKAWTPTKALRASYASWCESSGEKPISDRAFTNKLGARGLRAGRGGSPATRGWSGIRVLQSDT